MPVQWASIPDWMRLCANAVNGLLAREREADIVALGSTWTNGSFDRRGLVVATATGTFTGNPNNSLGATPVNNFWFAATAGAQEVTFDFANPRVLTGLLIQQDTASAQGTWTFEGSNDNVTYTPVVASFNWNAVALSTVFQHKLEFTNTVAYRYWRLRKTAGSTTTPFINWFAFKCEPIE